MNVKEMIFGKKSNVNIVEKYIRKYVYRRIVLNTFIAYTLGLSEFLNK